eukprot:2801606-Rhodomonas_salina.1
MHATHTYASSVPPSAQCARNQSTINRTARWECLLLYLSSQRAYLGRVSLRRWLGPGEEEGE